MYHPEYFYRLYIISNEDSGNIQRISFLSLSVTNQQK